jgi:hypothetical protein
VDISKLFLIRHAITDFNVEFARVFSTFGSESDELRNLKVRTDLIDPPINKLGIQQCLNG